MLRTGLDAEGAGLAGTQVGFLRRVQVFRASPEEEIQALVNLGVVAGSSERAAFVEGGLCGRGLGPFSCLSGS